MLPQVRPQHDETIQPQIELHSDCKGFKHAGSAECHGVKVQHLLVMNNQQSLIQNES